jgi:hypothetical protein
MKDGQSCKKLHGAVTPQWSVGHLKCLFKVLEDLFNRTSETRVGDLDLSVEGLSHVLALQSALDARYMLTSPQIDKYSVDDELRRRCRAEINTRFSGDDHFRRHKHSHIQCLAHQPN